jgi:hypothetical protein
MDDEVNSQDLDDAVSVTAYLPQQSQIPSPEMKKPISFLQATNAHSNSSVDRILLKYTPAEENGSSKKYDY